MTEELNPYQPPQSDLWPAQPEQNLSLMFGDEAIATFQYLLNDAWHQAVHDRRGQAARSPNARGGNGLVWLAVLFVTLIGFLTIVAGRSLFDPVLVTLAMVALALFGLYQGLMWFVRREFRQSKSYNTLATSIVYREGIVTQQQVASAAVSWAAFHSAARFPDGFLLNLTIGSYWLPMAGLTTGRVEDIATVLQSRVADYKVIRD